MQNVQIRFLMYSQGKNREKKTSFKVNEEAMLFDFAMRKMGSMSKNSLKNLLTKGLITVNGNTEKRPDHPLKEGDIVEISFKKASAGLSSSKLSIIYEDDYIIVVNKAAGVLSVATDKNETDTAFRIVMNHFKREDLRNRIYVVHRLDRETSGVLLFAKSKEIQMALQQNWQSCVLEKKYYAIVEGVIEEDKGTIHSWLYEEPKSKKVYSFNYDNGGLESFTDFKVTKRYNKYTALDVNLRTGRKNQIRVHLQSIGHPIIGDKKYGGSPSPIGRIGLHAERLVIQHPVTHKTLVLEAPLPDKMQKFR